MVGVRERRDAQPRQAALGEAQDVALAPQLEVALREREPVRRRGHRLEPLVLGRPLGGLRDEHAEARLACRGRRGRGAGGAGRARTAPRPRSPSSSRPSRRRRPRPPSCRRGRRGRRPGSAPSPPSRSAGLRRPWTSPTRSGASSPVEPLELRLGGGGPRRLHVLVDELVVLEEAVRLLGVASAAFGRRRRSAAPRRTCGGPRPPPRAPCPRSPRAPPGRRIPVRIGIAARRRRAERRHVEVRVQHLAQRPRDRRRGHEQDVRARRGSPSPRARHAARRRTGAARRRRRARGPRTPPPPGSARGCRRRSPPGRSRSPRAPSRRASPLSDPVRSVTGTPRSSTRSATVVPRAGGRGGRSARAAPPGGRRARRRRAPRRRPPSCPSPTSPWTSRSIGTGRARSSRISPIDVSWSAVSGASWPSLRASDASSATRISWSRGLRHLDRGRVRPSPRPPARDHAQLEGEQLVEREAAERGVARLERRRVVGVLERLRDGRQVLGGAELAAAGTPGRRSPPCPAPRASPGAASRRSARRSAGRRGRSGRRGAGSPRPPSGTPGRRTRSRTRGA